MSKRIFTPEQIDELLRNSNVLRCSKKSITYHHEFKTEAVRKYRDEGLSAMQIFKQAGFNVDVIGRKTPKHCLQDWRRIVAKQGAVGLSKETRGGPGRRQSPTYLTDQEKIKDLQMKVAYLKAENAFLVKLRAKQKR